MGRGRRGSGVCLFESVQMEQQQQQQVTPSLALAVRDLQARGLKHAAKWAAELLVGLPEGTDFTAVSQEAAAKVSQASLQDHGSAMYMLGKSYFDLGEYQRCAHALRGATTAGGGGGVGRGLEFFLRGYALYLAGERRKEEQVGETADRLEQSRVVNPNLKLLHSELEPVFRSRAGPGLGLGGSGNGNGSSSGGSGLDPFGLYLYGVVLKKMDRKTEAITVLCMACNQYPLNWSAWLDLATLCTETETVDKLPLQPHWARDFFYGHVQLELQQNDNALKTYSHLSGLFPRSTYLVAQTALAHYNLRSFDEAQDLYEALAKADPHRLKGMDTYSNILYVKECRAELSYLAHSAVQNNKYSPETCCIVGNYYSMKAHHEKAVLYFQRALRLNRRYLSAWTLMGHEFVEMKNTPAAIEAYRKAVDINPRDYRAWYGLGQTYEILQMYFYALYYYRKATTLRPYDARMWCALAGCYSHLDRTEEAIRCYLRAEVHGDREGIAAQKLAKLYAENLGNRKQAAHYYMKHLERRAYENGTAPGKGGNAANLNGGHNSGETGVPAAAADTPDTVEALRFLANYFKDQNDLGRAEECCRRLLDCSGPEKEEAKSLIREIKSRLSARATTATSTTTGPFTSEI